MLLTISTTHQPATIRGILQMKHPDNVHEVELSFGKGNREFDALFEGMKLDAMGHPDHRFEWTHAAFHHLAKSVALAHGYAIRFDGIGPEDPTYGHPSQVAIFRRTDEAKAAE